MENLSNQLRMIRRALMKALDISKEDADNMITEGLFCVEFTGGSPTTATLKRGDLVVAFIEQQNGEFNAFVHHT